MQVQALGHAVIKVRDLDRAERFYHGLLGIPLVGRHARAPMSFLTLGNHHDLALLAVGADAPDAPEKAPGLYHLAFKVGDTLDDLREARAALAAAGVQVDAVIDHTVTKSLYLRDPDGNGVELYVDASDVWRREPERVMDARPLAL